jgi:hypothetical protein
MPARGGKCWLLTEIPDEVRTSQGSASYADETGVVYRYDDSVPHHALPAGGDLAVLRRGDNVLGWAVICDITRRPGLKERRRCPSCGKTTVRKRTRTAPAWWCTACRAQVAEPRVTHERAVLYAAHFRDTFIPVASDVAVSALWPLAVRLNKQHSILQLDPDRTRGVLAIPSSIDPFAVASRAAPASSEGVAGALDFAPGHRRRSELPCPVSTTGAVGMRDTQHNRIQNTLYERLVREHGAENVATEVSPGDSSRIDAVVRLPDGKFDFYEIKVGSSIRSCLREAIGQLLEYTAFHDNSRDVSSLCVVTPQPLDDACRQWLARLNAMGLSIRHIRCVPDSSDSI